MGPLRLVCTLVALFFSKSPTEMISLAFFASWAAPIAANSINFDGDRLKDSLNILLQQTASAAHITYQVKLS